MLPIRDWGIRRHHNRNSDVPFRRHVADQFGLYCAYDSSSGRIANQKSNAPPPISATSTAIRFAPDMRLGSAMAISFRNCGLITTLWVQLARRHMTMASDIDLAKG